MIGGELFIELTLSTALQVMLLGFIGGTLSGFIGSGGAFFMTPGMMNLGVPGTVAVASNITHKFGKALVGSKKHGEMGNVDKVLGLLMLTTAAAGIGIAVFLNTYFLKVKKGSAAGDLYISAIFVSFLVVVAISMLRDVWKSGSGAGPSMRIAELCSRIRLRPILHLKVADVKVSLWVILPIGLVTGFLAGTIGVGGFIGVPAMIYVLGIPTAVAAGTELFLAMFMGAWGCLLYAWTGVVDLRLTLLMYVGSLVGIHLGAYGTKIVKEVYIRLVTGIIILLCVLSRIIATPEYMRKLGYLDIDAGYDMWWNGTSKALLFASGITGVVVILVTVARGYLRRRRIQASLAVARA
ncbi:sulfite exporter TauE/SafE family protein [Planctomycetota bacterium]